MSVVQHRGSGQQQAPIAKYLTIVVAGVFIILGGCAAIAPDWVVATSRDLVSTAGIYTAAALRAGVGIALLYIARNSRSPGILRIMGAVCLAFALVMPILGIEDAKTRIEWEAQNTTFLRLEGLLFMWAGYVIYKLAQPPDRLAQSESHQAP